jgi:hypothetical protein
VMLIVVRGIHGFWSVATRPDLQGGALDIGTHIIFLLALVLGIERTVEASFGLSSYELLANAFLRIPAQLCRRELSFTFDIPTYLLQPTVDVP